MRCIYFVYISQKYVYIFERIHICKLEVFMRSAYTISPANTYTKKVVKLDC